MTVHIRGFLTERRLMILITTLAISACSSVTIRPNGGSKELSEPSYMDSKAFFFWGLVGNHNVDVNEVCEGSNVIQMQTVMTASDYLLGLPTLFIYAPRTAKVWCEQ